MNRIVLWVAVVAALALPLAGAAHADTYGTLTANFINVSPGYSVTVNAQSSVSPYGWYSAGTTAGLYNFTKTGGTTTVPVGTSFSTHCIDLTTLTANPHTWTVMDVTDAPDPTTYSGIKITGEKLVDLQKLFSRNDPSSNLLAAARQVAVWEVVFERGDSYKVTEADGTFYVTNYVHSLDDVGAKANDMLNDLGGWEYLEWVPDLYAFVAEGDQDQIWLVVGGGAPYVPEPLTVLGMVFGLGSVGAYIRRRRMA